MENVRVWINGQECEVPAGTTILKAAEELGTYIPTLCYHPYLKPSGNCRLCAVEIEGQRGLPASCSNVVTDGMKIKTDTEKVREFRRETLRLILRDYPQDAIGWIKDQPYELREVIEHIGFDTAYLPSTEKRYEMKDGGPFFNRDYNLCVRCGRCVRACHEIRGAGAIVFREEEGREEVSTPFGRPLEEVGCQFCAACVDVCPTGALTDKFPALGKAAEERERIKSICPYCGVGCSLIFEVQDGKIVRTMPDPDGPANKGQDCVKGRFGISEFVHSSDRLTAPLIRKEGALTKASWEEALNRVAAKFSQYAPEEIAVIASAKCTNEENYLIQKFGRAVLKTNSIDHCARL
ncbi:MAG: (2Fe-2S)-binding protein [Syntrophaceae bacterium]|nr:(2Fe-2S)-binding protein [Syntrophaceae bacterium]